MRAAVAAASFMSLASLGPGIARATTVTATFTYPSPLLGYASANGTSFPQFSPAAGTLTSITLHATATATWSGGASTDFNDAEYAIFLSGVAFTMGAATVGDGSAPASANRTDTAPAALSSRYPRWCTRAFFRGANGRVNRRAAHRSFESRNR